MPNTHTKARGGFILAEALVALAVFGATFLALEGSLTLALRSLAESDREAIASRLAETTRERAFASGCLNGAGSDSANGVVLAWVATTENGLLRLVESTTYRRRAGDRSQRYEAVGRCS